MKHKEKPPGPLLGAHMSIAGGVDKSLLLGKTVDCDAIQIFTKSSRQWAAKPYTKEEIELFDFNRKATRITTVISHDSYLLNLGSPDDTLRKRSVAAFIDELERSEILGVSNLVAHPGDRVGAGEDEGIKTIARSLDEVHTACPGFNVKVTQWRRGLQRCAGAAARRAADALPEDAPALPGDRPLRNAGT